MSTALPTSSRMAILLSLLVTLLACSVPASSLGLQPTSTGAPAQGSARIASDDGTVNSTTAQSITNPPDQATAHAATSESNGDAAISLSVTLSPDATSQDQTSQFPTPTSDAHPELTPNVLVSPGAISQHQTPQPANSPARFNGCSGTGPVDFAYSPMRLEDVLHLLPYGMLAGAHVTPIDHMYFEPHDRSLGRDMYEVRAVQDGVIYNLQPRDINVDTGQSRQREWRMDIAHSCTFTSYFDLLTSLDPALEAEWNKTQGGRNGPWQGIPVKAGQVVGRIGAQTLDFGVYDYEVTLPGFVVPSHYTEPWKVHTVDPFPFFPDGISDALLNKMLRQAEPRAGKIDHDVDGTLAGNWFQVGTNGYAGLDQRQYWDGHLSLVPDGLDPTQWRFSIGNYAGSARQFGIKGNSPDPRDVTAATGIVMYELTYYDYFASNDPSRHGLGPSGVQAGDIVASRNQDQVIGVALLQMSGDRIVLCEVFPGKTAAEVVGFTSGVRAYER